MSSCSKTFLILLTCSSLQLGCERKEKVVEINTPGGGVEVNKDKDTGEVDVKIGDK